MKSGKRWSYVSKVLFENSRNEHMIKNRYNSLIRKCQKKYGKVKNYDERVLEEIEIQFQ